MFIVVCFCSCSDSFHMDHSSFFSLLLIIFLITFFFLSFCFSSSHLFFIFSHLFFHLFPMEIEGKTRKIIEELRSTEGGSWGRRRWVGGERHELSSKEGKKEKEEKLQLKDIHAKEIDLGREKRVEEEEEEEGEKKKNS